MKYTVRITDEELNQMIQHITPGQRNTVFVLAIRAYVAPGGLAEVTNTLASIQAQLDHLQLSAAVNDISSPTVINEFNPTVSPAVKAGMQSALGQLFTADDDEET